MALARFQRTLTDTAGNVRNGVEVTVRDESTGGIAAIFSDKAGTTAKNNPVTTDSFGFFSFYTSPGRYRIQATGVDWRDEDLVTVEGLNDAVTAAEAARDAAQLNAGIYADTTAGLAATSDGDYFSTPSGDSNEYLILYRNDTGSATQVAVYPTVAGADEAIRNELVQPVATFNNVQGMIDSTALSVGRKARTLGYFSPGDGGGNDYAIVAAGTGTDDGGSFIDLTGSGLQASALFKRPISIKHFGAVGDGITDDSAAIQNAVNYLSDGGSAFVPKGDYLVSQTIDFTASDVKIYGESSTGVRNANSNWPSRLVWGGVDAGTMIEVDPNLTGSVRSCGFEQIVLDGAQTTDVTLIRARNGAAKCWLWGVTLRNMSNGVILEQSNFSWLFEQVSFFNFDNIGADLRGTSHESTFIHCRSENVNVITSSSTVRIGVDDRVSNVNFYGCDFEAAETNYQIEAIECRNLVWCGGYMEAPSSSMVAFIRLGSSTNLTGVDGFYCSGYFQCGNPSLVPQVFLVDYACNGVVIESCDFKGTVSNSIVRNNGGTKISRFGANSLNGNKVFSGSLIAEGFDHSTPVQITIADDNFIALTPPSIFSNNVAVGKMEVWVRRQPSVGGAILYDSQGAAAGTVLLYSTANFNNTTGALAGTTGVDGSLTVSSHTDGKIYIENRLGQSNDVIYSFCEPWGDST